MVFRGEFDAQGINVLLIFVELEVEVRPGGSARGANKANYLSFGNTHTGLDAFGKAVLSLPVHYSPVVERQS